MKKILVTGASGFLGRHILLPLRERGFEVHAVGRSLPSADLATLAVWHTADLLQPEVIRNLLRQLRPEGLMHLAWDTTPGVYWKSPANLEWTAASLHLLHDFAQAGGTRAVIAGSSAEYQWGGEAPLDELATPLLPDSLYGCSRNALREVVAAWAPGAGISWTWGRLFNIFGPDENPARLIPKVIRTLLRGGPLPFDEGLLVRDFLHVGDAGDAFAALFQSPVQGPVNVASGGPLSIRELITTLAGHLNAGDRVVWGAKPDQPDQPARVVAAVRRLRDEVGWQPPVSLTQRLRETCDWWRATEVVATGGKRN
jgi:nucleoside-diphosphate-sugar epimerase